MAALGAALLGAGAPMTATQALAGGYAYDDDLPATVVTRRTIVERPVVVQPRRVVREVVVERPVVVRPRRVVREVVEERPVVVRPRPAFRDVVVERDRFYGRPVRPVGYGPALDDLDD